MHLTVIGFVFLFFITVFDFVQSCPNFCLPDCFGKSYSDNVCFNTKYKPDATDTTKYRTIDGTGNNLFHRNYGAVGTPFLRVLPAVYDDGIHRPRKSKAGGELPSARLVRTSCFPDGEILDSVFSNFVMLYGQGIAHDVLSSVNNNITVQEPCCPSQGPTETCISVEVPKNDSRFEKCCLPTNETCMSLVRSVPVDCATTKEKQIPNDVSSYLDLSIVYGNNSDKAKLVRLYEDGLLKYQIINNKMFLPNGAKGCLDCETRKAKYCFITGDDRGNENTMLTALQTIYVKEHNRIAKILKEINPCWNDETIFQETRKIVIAAHQLTVYREWLPIVVGTETMTKMNLYPSPIPLDSCYDPEIDATTILSFNTGCFRHFHTVLRSDVQFYSSFCNKVGAMNLSDTFLFPDPLVDKFDELLRGFICAPMQKSDTKHTEEITQKLFKGCGKCKADLLAFDIQRQADHGLPSYIDVRSYCGFCKACTFDDFGDLIMDRAAIETLKKLYKCPDDVPLFVGTGLETPCDGLFGPTCKCLFALQFRNYKCGDRFFFPSFLTPEQAKEVYKLTAAHLFCNNGNNFPDVVKKAFELPSSSNPVVPCSSLPQPDFSKWKSCSTSSCK